MAGCYAHLAYNVGLMQINNLILFQEVYCFKIVFEWSIKLVQHMLKWAVDTSGNSADLFIRSKALYVDEKRSCVFIKTTSQLG